MWQVWFRNSQKRGTEESCGDWSQGWDYQCDECDFAAVRTEELKSHVKTVHRDGDYQCDEYNFAAVINKLMLKQFVVVVQNV